MKKITYAIMVPLIAFALLAACTDRQRGKLSAFGGQAEITCYSGEKQIYNGKSTGKISSEENSDGYSFVDADTNMLVEVSGNCVIKYTSY